MDLQGRSPLILATCWVQVQTTGLKLLKPKLIVLEWLVLYSLCTIALLSNMRISGFHKLPLVYTMESSWGPITHEFRIERTEGTKNCWSGSLNCMYYLEYLYGIASRVTFDTCLKHNDQEKRYATFLKFCSKWHVSVLYELVYI